jgi:hypothetical protein
MVQNSKSSKKKVFHRSVSWVRRPQFPPDRSLRLDGDGSLTHYRPGNSSPATQLSKILIYKKPAILSRPYESVNGDVLPGSKLFPAGGLVGFEALLAADM